MIGKHLKNYKKEYLAERKLQPRRARIKKNSDWRKRWIPFIKYDHDFDGLFLIDLMVHKLHIMLDYYEHGKYCAQADESRLEIVESLKEACRLGDLIIADKFNDKAFAFMDEHCSIHFGSHKSNKDNSEIKMGWDSPENEAEFNKLMAEADALREKTIDEFFNFIRKNYHFWWD